MAENRIYELRKSKHLTQEAFAELLMVSRQAVQKWEKGKSLPEGDKLIRISKMFNISADYLLGIDDSDPASEFRVKKEVLPDYSSLHRWEMYSSQLNNEYLQCIDEGKDISVYKPLMDSISGMETSVYKEQLADVVYNIIQNAPMQKDYPYNEPDDLASIQALSKTDAQYTFDMIPVNVLKNRIKGAWVGRIVGCLLGKTVEGIRTNELIPLLKETGNYPMHRYIQKSDMNEEIYNKYKYNLRNRCYADDIDHAPSDDDTNYTVLSAIIIDEYTDDFTSSNVAKAWLEKQPKNAYCTAERVAYLNFIKGYMPADSAIYKNPFREWIGAQIRADYYGYINPKDPDKAAFMAWKDARISHVKNGIYAPMLIASITSVAAYCDSMKQAVVVGLEQIPTTCRLHKAVTKILKQYENNVPCEKVFDGIHIEFDEYCGHHWCLAISNACIVIASLLYGNGEFARSICLAVQTGFDTDCNGATVGSITGMRCGINQIPEIWTKPINNKLDTSIFGVGTINVDYVCDLAMKHICRYSLHYKEETDSRA